MKLPIACNCAHNPGSITRDACAQSGQCQGYDNDDELTLELLAFDLGPVCQHLDAEGHHEAAQSLRDQAECVVREMIAEASR